MVVFQISSRGDAVGATSLIRVCQVDRTPVTRGSECSSSSDWAIHRGGNKLKTWFLLPAALLVARKRSLARSALASRASGTSSGPEVGSFSRVGKAGRSHLQPGTQHMSPVAPAGKFGLPKAPSSHRDNYSDSSCRGPRFNNLPPPADIVYNSQQGAAQPALMSRLDAYSDIRLASDVSLGAELPHTADNVCLVPEPYCRTIRPDQRMRAVAAWQPQEDMLPSMETHGRFFKPEIDNSERVSPFRYYTDSQLRKRLQDSNLPISGGRADLISRLSYNRQVEKMTKQERIDLCSRLGLDVNQSPQAQYREITTGGLGLWLSLSVEDLIFENIIRGRAVSGTETKKQLLQSARGRPVF